MDRQSRSHNLLLSQMRLDILDNSCRFEVLSKRAQFAQAGQSQFSPSHASAMLLQDGFLTSDRQPAVEQPTNQQPNANIVPPIPVGKEAERQGQQQVSKEATQPRHPQQTAPSITTVFPRSTCIDTEQLVILFSMIGDVRRVVFYSREAPLNSSPSSGEANPFQFSDLTPYFQILMDSGLASSNYVPLSQFSMISEFCFSDSVKIITMKDALTQADSTAIEVNVQPLPEVATLLIGKITIFLEDNLSPLEIRQKIQSIEKIKQMLTALTQLAPSYRMKELIATAPESKKQGADPPYFEAASSSILVNVNSIFLNFNLEVVHFLLQTEQLLHQQAKKPCQIWFYDMIEGQFIRAKHQVAEGFDYAAPVIEEKEEKEEPLLYKTLQTSEIQTAKSKTGVPITSQFGSTYGVVLIEGTSNSSVGQILLRETTDFSQIIETTLLKLHSAAQLAQTQNQYGAEGFTARSQVSNMAENLRARVPSQPSQPREELVMNLKQPAFGRNEGSFGQSSSMVPQQQSNPGGVASPDDRLHQVTDDSLEIVNVNAVVEVVDDDGTPTRRPRDSLQPRQAHPNQMELMIEDSGSDQKMPFRNDLTAIKETVNEQSTKGPIQGEDTEQVSPTNEEQHINLKSLFAINGRSSKKIIQFQVQDPPTCRDTPFFNGFQSSDGHSHGNHPGMRQIHIENQLSKRIGSTESDVFPILTQEEAQFHSQGTGNGANLPWAGPQEADLLLQERRTEPEQYNSAVAYKQEGDHLGHHLRGRLNVDLPQPRTGQVSERNRHGENSHDFGINMSQTASYNIQSEKDQLSSNIKATNNLVARVNIPQQKQIQITHGRSTSREGKQPSSRRTCNVGSSVNQEVMPLDLTHPLLANNEGAYAQANTQMNQNTLNSNALNTLLNFNSKTSQEQSNLSKTQFDVIKATLANGGDETLIMASLNGEVPPSSPRRISQAQVATALGSQFNPFWNRNDGLEGLEKTAAAANHTQEGQRTSLIHELQGPSGMTYDARELQSPKKVKQILNDYADDDINRQYSGFLGHNELTFGDSLKAHFKRTASSNKQSQRQQPSSFERSFNHSSKSSKALGSGQPQPSQIRGTDIKKIGEDLRKPKSAAPSEPKVLSDLRKIVQQQPSQEKMKQQPYGHSISQQNSFRQKANTNSSNSNRTPRSHRKGKSSRISSRPPSTQGQADISERIHDQKQMNNITLMNPHFNLVAGPSTLPRGIMASIGQDQQTLKDMELHYLVGESIPQFTEDNSPIKQEMATQPQTLKLKPYPNSSLVEGHHRVNHSEVTSKLIEDSINAGTRQPHNNLYPHKTTAEKEEKKTLSPMRVPLNAEKFKNQLQMKDPDHTSYTSQNINETRGGGDNLTQIDELISSQGRKHHLSSMMKRRGNDAINQSNASATKLGYFSSNKVASKQESPEQRPVFNDNLDKFVEILKKTTQATIVHIYTPELIQIYQDYSSVSSYIDHTDLVSDISRGDDPNSKVTSHLREKLEKFQREVVLNQEESLSQLDVSYQIPAQAYFRLYRCRDNTASQRKVAVPKEGSGIQGIDIFLAKVTFDGRDGRERVLVFQCIFHASLVQLKHYPEMFINICQNFLEADQVLKSDIEVLLDIASGEEEEECETVPEDEEGGEDDQRREKLQQTLKLTQGTLQMSQRIKPKIEAHSLNQTMLFPSRQDLSGQSQSFLSQTMKQQQQMPFLQRNAEKTLRPNSSSFQNLDSDELLYPQPPEGLNQQTTVHQEFDSNTPPALNHKQYIDQYLKQLSSDLTPSERVLDMQIRAIPGQPNAPPVIIERPIVMKSQQIGPGSTELLLRPQMNQLSGSRQQQVFKKSTPTRRSAKSTANHSSPAGATKKVGTKASLALRAPSHSSGAKPGSRTGISGPASVANSKSSGGAKKRSGLSGKRSWDRMKV